MHSIFIYLRAAFAIVLTFLVLGAGALFILFGSLLTLGRAQNFFIEHVASRVAQLILLISGVRMRVENRIVPARPVIYIINHASTLDMFLIVSLRLPKTKFIAKYEFLYNPIFFIYGKLTGQIFVKRQDSEHAIRVLQNAYRRILKNGYSLLVAPEGTRRHPGTIGPFKKGAFRMAVDLKYPILPIHLQGARQLCPDKSLIVRPGVVRATFHDLIDTETWDLDSLDMHIESIRNKYIELEESSAQAAPGPEN